MQNKLHKLSCSAILFLLLLPLCIYSQDFSVSQMIEIPGNNEDFDVFSVWSDSYLCWINTLDSVHTVYLKQLSPVLGDNMIVASDSSEKKNPVVARGESGIRIAWQTKNDDNWQVYTRNYLSDQFGDPELILDSLENDPQIALSYTRLAWINEGNLYIRTFGSDPSTDMLLDSCDCSSPKLLKFDSDLYLEMLYVKNIDDSLKVYHVRYNEYSVPKYLYSCLSNGPLSDHPGFGAEAYDRDGWISFQTKVNDIWKCVYGVFETNDMEITGNRDCNFQHPVLFTYPIPTSSGISTPYFLAFDTDSLAGNKEIFIQPVVYWDQGPAMNISQSPGDDRKPAITWLWTGDSMFVSIFWEHEENNKTDIWYAKTPFSDGSAIRDDAGNPVAFDLIGNYPNPFNPQTTIEYVLKKPCHVKIAVYDVSGKKVKTILNAYKNNGKYKKVFNADELTSGIYYCRMTSGDHTQSIAMVLLK